MWQMSRVFKPRPSVSATLVTSEKGALGCSMVNSRIYFVFGAHSSVSYEMLLHILWESVFTLLLSIRSNTKRKSTWCDCGQISVECGCKCKARGVGWMQMQAWASGVTNERGRGTLSFDCQWLTGWEPRKQPEAELQRQKAELIHLETFPDLRTLMD